MFEELIIQSNPWVKKTVAAWDPDTKYILIDAQFIILNPENKQIRSIEEMIDLINFLFLAEFMCMEASGGCHKNVDCTPKWKILCGPAIVALNMMYDEINNLGI